MYLNIILTLIFLTLGLIALASFTSSKYTFLEHEKAKKYNKEVNDEVIELHWLILKAIEKDNEGA